MPVSSAGAKVKRFDTAGELCEYLNSIMDTITQVLHISYVNDYTQVPGWYFIYVGD